MHPCNECIRKLHAAEQTDDEHNERHEYRCAEAQNVLDDVIEDIHPYALSFHVLKANHETNIATESSSDQSNVLHASMKEIALTD